MLHAMPTIGEYGAIDNRSEREKLQAELAKLRSALATAQARITELENRAEAAEKGWFDDRERAQDLEQQCDMWAHRAETAESKLDEVTAPKRALNGGCDCEACEPTSLGEALPREIARVRDEVIPAYQEIGVAGRFALIIAFDALDRASKAMIEGDAVAMVRVYEELKRFTT